MGSLPESESSCLESSALRKGSRFKRVCVFCGSSSGKRDCYKNAAVELGQELVYLYTQISFHLEHIHFVQVIVS